MSRNYKQEYRKETWESLSQITIAKTIDQWSKRVQAVVNADGGHIGSYNIK